MKNNPLSDIIKCNVEISNPASSDVSFDSILLVVPSPYAEPDIEPSDALGTKRMTATTAISKADDLLEYGFEKSSPAYKAAEVAFSQNPSPDKLYICIRKTNEDSDEDIATTLARAASECNFYGIHLTSFRDSDDLAAAVDWAEANEKLYGFEVLESNEFDPTPYFRTFAIFAGNADGYDGDYPEENQFAALAMMAKCFGYAPGSETWAMKELAAITPSVLSYDMKAALEEANVNAFLRYAGSNVTVGGKTLAGEWIDVIRFRDWLKATMQERVFNVLKRNRKVPFNDGGIGLIEGAMESTLRDGQDVGGIDVTVYDDDGNEIPGYTITVPYAGDLTEEERKSRKLTGVSYTARLAGAIHAVEIEGYLTF